MVGHKFDASLDNCCYGARLKRIRNDELFSNEQDNPFHISAVGSFSPYFQPYQKWRGDGLKLYVTSWKRSLTLSPPHWI